MNAITPIVAKRAVRLPIQWTDEQVKTLTDLWNSGKSAREIGEVLGFSGSAIIGKAHRLDLARHGRTKAQTLEDARITTKLQRKAIGKRDRRHDGNGGKASQILSRVAAMPNLKPVNSSLLKSDVWNALPGTTPVSLADLPANGCKWPIGDAPILFCACERHTHSQYCETHHSRAYAGFGKGIDGKAGPRHA